MFLVDLYTRVSPAKSTPHKDEDPFSRDSVEAIDSIRHRHPQIFERPERIGIAFANCFGGWTFGEQQLKNLRDKGPRRVSAYQSVAWFPPAAQGRVTIANGIVGPALTFSTEFFAFYDALQVAAHWLNTGTCDIGLVGAAEALGSTFLSKALGEGNTSDVIVWFVLARSGPIRIIFSNEPSLDGATVIQGETFQTTPLRGACALPLIIAEAVRNPPAKILVPTKVLISSIAETLLLRRLDREHAQIES